MSNCIASRARFYLSRYSVHEVYGWRITGHTSVTWTLVVNMYFTRSFAVRSDNCFHVLHSQTSAIWNTPFEMKARASRVISRIRRRDEISLVFNASPNIEASRISSFLVTGHVWQQIVSYKAERGTSGNHLSTSSTSMARCFQHVLNAQLSSNERPISSREWQPCLLRFLRDLLDTRHCPSCTVFRVHAFHHRA